MRASVQQPLAHRLSAHLGTGRKGVARAAAARAVRADLMCHEGPVASRPSWQIGQFELYTHKWLDVVVELNLAPSGFRVRCQGGSLQSFVTVGAR